MAGRLDRIDLKILRLLQNSGRLTNAELAETAGVSAATCHRRTQRLFDEEIVPLETRKKVTDRQTGETHYETVTLTKDEGNRPQTTLESLQALKPVAREYSMVTQRPA